MIAKLFKPKKSIGPLVRYVLRDGITEPPCQIIGGSVVGTDSATLLQEFMVGTDMRRDVLRPIIHASLSIPVGLSLTPAQWLSAARRFLMELGFHPLEDHQYMVVQHSDKPHQHVHVIASRISITTGKPVREALRDFRLAHCAAASAAREVGLTPVIPRRRQPGARMRSDSRLPPP